MKIGKVTTKSADCNGCVLEQIFKGKVAEPGQKIKKGSVIDLVVGVKDNFGAAVSDSLVQNADQGSFDNE